MGIRGQSRLWANFKPGEGETAGILFLQSFLSGFASTFFFVTASVSFISKASVNSLPLAYILSGLVGFVLLSVYKRRVTRAGALAAYRGSIWAYFALCLALFAAFWCCSGSPLALYVAYLSYVIVMPFSTMLALGFSTLCLSVFDMGQSKRLLALVSTGDTVAAIGAYLFVPFFTRFISPSVAHLLLLAAGFALCALLPLQVLNKRYARQFQFVPPAVSAAKADFFFFTKDKFYQAIAVASFFSVLAIFLADYSYLISVRYLAMQTEWQLTSIVSGLFCIIKAGELATSLWSKNILNRRGMQFSLLLLPASLVFATGMAFLCSHVFSEFPFFLLTFLLLSKWSERVIRKGLTAPAMRVLYQVAPPAERLKSQTVIEGSLSQLFTAVSGGLLLAVSSAYVGAETIVFLQGMAVAGFLAYCCWLLATWKLVKNYKLKILRYLRNAKQQKGYFASSLATAEAAAPAAAKPDNAALPAKLDWQQIIADELRGLTEKENGSLLPVVGTYNPAMLLAAQDKDKDEEWLYKNLVRTYLSNGSFFSRLSIVWYMQQMPPAYGRGFVREVYEGSELALRQQLVRLLIKLDYRPQGNEVYYFMELCRNCAADVAWLLAAQYDTATVENPALAAHLLQLIHWLKRLLFSLLAVIHDAASIQETEEILLHQNGSAENQLFAIELLDSMLKAGLKDYIIPLFEDIPFSTLKSRLQQIFPVYNVPVRQRLKELTMKDFKLIDPATRQLAMEAYFQLTKDDSLLQAFAASKLENMAAASGRLLTGLPPAPAPPGANATQRTRLLAAHQALEQPHLMDTATRFEARKYEPGNRPPDRYDAAKHTAYLFTDDGCLTVDALSLAMLYKLQA